MIADVEPDVNSRAGRRNPIPCEYRVGYGPPDERGEIGRPARDVPADGAGDTAGFAFTSAVTGGRVPREYVRAFEAGCRDALVEGPLGGHPVTGVLVRLVDGATHPNDSSELAFRVAGRLGLRAALRSCEMGLLEPVVEVVVTAPPDCLGAVLGGLAVRRGQVGGTDARGGSVVVTATVPLARLFGYATELRSRTAGRGSFTGRPAGHQPVPTASAPGRSAG